MVWDCFSAYGTGRFHVTEGINSTDLLTKVQYSAGKPWILTFMWIQTIHPNTLADEVHPHGSDSPE